MIELTALATQYRETFLFVFFRMSGMLAVAPLIGHRSVPIPHRAGLAALLALLLTPLYGGASAARGGDGLALVLAVLGELFVGLVIGFVASLVVAAVQSAGELVGFQMGLGIAAAYDPAMGHQMNVLTRLYELLALLLFLALNGHHVLLQAVAASFQRIQPGAVLVQSGVAAGVVALGGKLFRSGLELAAPVVGILFAVNVALALLARVAPAMNVFALSMPLMVGVGIFAFAETSPYVFGVVARLIREIGGELSTVLLGASHGV